jgi:Flp pilus assembly protein TadD
VNYLPEWCPGAGFKKTARQMRAQLHQTTEQPYRFVKKQMRENKAKASFLSQAIETNPDMESLLKWSASSMYVTSVFHYQLRMLMDILGISVALTRLSLH